MNEQQMILFLSLTIDGDIANTVQKAHVKLIDFDECNAAYDFELNERIHICAGYMVGGIDTCQVSQFTDLF